jgi:cell division inhibitor SulA
MFIRQYFKQENGHRTAYWALVESYRAANGPRQRVVAWLGKLDEAGRLGILRAAEEAKQSAAQHRPTTASSRLIISCGLNSMMSLHCSRDGLKSMPGEFVLRICDSSVDHGWLCI